MDLNKYILVSFLVIGLYSCSTDKTSYVEYVNDPSNELTQVHSSKDWTYSLQYRTPELMALIESGNSKLNRFEFSEIVDQYSDLDYYLLTIKSKGSSQTSTQLIDHLSFDFKNQIIQVSKLDSLVPKLYHFESGLTSFGEYRFLVGFESWDEGDRQIQIKKFDKDMNIQFSISSQAIASITTLEI